jgi:antitoxin YefM
MTPVSANEARDNLQRLIDQAAASHEPLLIAGERNSAVLVAVEDWDAIQETLYLLAIPGMRESIRDGLATPTGECSQEPGW